MNGVFASILLSIVTISSLSGQTIQSSGGGTGTWNDPNSWSPATVPTTGNSTSVIIQSGHTITVTDTRSIDQMTVNGTLIIAGVANMTIANGSTGSNPDALIAAGGALTNNGTLTIASGSGFNLCRLEVNGLSGNPGRINNSGTIAFGNGSSRIFFNAFSLYDHQFVSTPGAIPANGAAGITWNISSTCLISGYVDNTAVPSGLNQTFGNFTWDTPNLNAGGNLFDLDGQLSDVNGDLTINSVGVGGDVVYLGFSNPYTLNIDGDFIINDGFVGFTNDLGATATVNVQGDFALNGGFVIMGTDQGDVIMDVDGAFNLSGGDIDFAFGAGSTTLNLAGDVTLSASSVSSSGGVTDLVFNSAGLQNYSSATTVFGVLNYEITTGTLVALGNSPFTGDGDFLLNAGAAMQVGSPDGLVTGTSLGNVQVSGTRTYVPTANIIYSGVTQNLGNEWAASGALNGVAVNLELINGTVVTNNNIGSTSLVGVLTLTNGRFNIGNTNTLDIRGDFFSTGSGTIGGSSTSNLTFSNAGSVGTLNMALGAQVLNNLSITRAETVTLGSNLTIVGVLDLSVGNLDFSGRALTINGSGITSGGGLICTNTSDLIFGGGSFSSSVPFQGTGNQLRDLTINTPSGTFTWNSPVEITRFLTLSNGTIIHSSGLTMGSGSTFIRSGGSLTTTDPDVVTSYNVTYTGSVTTGLELPNSSTELNSLTINSSGPVTLDKNITVNGNVNLQGSTLVANGFNITLAGSSSQWNRTTGSFSGGSGTLIIDGNTTIVAPSVTPSFTNITVNNTRSLTLPSGNINVSGNLVNNGTITPGTSTVIFNGTSTISGSSATSLNNVTVSGSLVAPGATMLSIAGNFTNNGTFNNNNGSVTFNGTTSILGSNVSNFNNVTITGTLTASSTTTLGIRGNLTNSSGTFNHNNGTVTFNGTIAAQSVSGSPLTFNNITASNPITPGVSINNTSRLNGTLTLTSGAFFDADGSGSGVFIVSSTSQTAGGRIANLPNPTNFTGAVTVERYIHGKSGGDYRYLSVPITNGNLSVWTNSIGVTGNFSDRSTNPPFSNILNSGNTNPSVQTFNGSTQQYVNVNGSGGPTSGTSLSNTTGYAVYDFLDGAITASYRGTIGKGNVVVTVSSTNGNFNLVPNPYPSPIDWDNVTKTNVNNAMYLRVDPNVFSSYVGGVANNEPFIGWTGEVATGQSFWVTSNGSGSTLSFKEADKSGNQFYFLRTKSADNYFRMRLTSSSGVKDESVLRFDENGSDGFEPDLDAVKLRNGSDPIFPMITRGEFLNLSSYLDGDNTEFAINTIKTLDGPKIVRMNVADVKVGTYSISFSDLTLLRDAYNIVLVDTYLNKETDVSDGTTYEFQVTENEFSFGTERFYLRINGEPAKELEQLGNGIKVFPNPTTDFIQISLTPDQENSLRSIQIVDLHGDAIVNSDNDPKLMQPGVRKIDMQNTSSGLYLLNIRYGDKISSTKIVKR